MWSCSNCLKTCLILSQIEVFRHQHHQMLHNLNDIIEPHKVYKSVNIHVEYCVPFVEYGVVRTSANPKVTSSDPGLVNVSRT